VIQYPLGYLSDRWDRRRILLLTSLFALLSALVLAIWAGESTLFNFVAVFVFGSFAMPMFSLSAAHANDRADRSEFVLVNAALMLFYSIGAMAGPFAAATVMELFGPAWLFYFNAAVYAALIAIILYRMQVRGPAQGRSRFIALLRTSPIFARLARRNGGDKR
jgi:MFS family permease